MRLVMVPLAFATAVTVGCGGSPTAADSTTTPAPAQNPATATSLTFAADVQPLLVVVSRPGGIMYSNWRGSAPDKAETIRRWVVDFKAAQ